MKNLVTKTVFSTDEGVKLFFMDNATGMFILDDAQIILDVNKAGCALFDASRGKLLGNSFLSQVEVKDKGILQEEMNQLATGVDQLQNFECRFVSVKGRKIFGLVQCTRYDITNDTTCYVVQITDITEQKRMEQEVRESRERYKLLSNITFEGVLVHDHGLAIDMNPVFANIFGYHINELIGKNLVPLLIEEQYHNYIEQNINTDYQKPYEVVGVKKDGTRLPVELESRNHDFFGKTIRITAVRDLTERNKTQKALIESEEKFRQIFNLSAGLMCVADLKAARFITVNPAFIEKLGYTEEEMLSKSFIEFIHPDDIEETERVVKKELQKGATVINFENRYRCRDGSYKWFAWNTRPVMEKGITYSMALDITGIKELEHELILKNEELHTQNEEYLVLNEELAENIHQKETINKKLLLANETDSLKNAISNAFILHEDDSFYGEVLDHLLGFMKCEFGFFGYIDEQENLVTPSLTRNIWEKCQVPDKSLVFPKELWSGIWGESLLKKKTIIKNKGLILPEGHVQLKNAIAVPIINNKKLIGQIALGNRNVDFENDDVAIMEQFANYLAPLLMARLKEDLYLEQLIEAKNKAEESDRLKSSFLANMSHEIRTPLNGILGFTNLLTRTNDLNADQQRRYQSIIEKSSENLMQIVNDILDFSRIEIGEMEFSPRPILINRFLFDLHTLFTSKVMGIGKKIQIHYRQAPERVSIYADEVRLNQIFNNLLSNALKFTDEGLIEYGYSRIEEGKIFFFVSDTGIGIPPEKMDIIFERFRQGEASMNRVYGGNGLGLSIVKSLVELMGGEITVQSEVNKGTVFTFNLPYQSKNEIEHSENETTQTVLDDSQGIKVLVVEDDPVSLLFLRELLDEKGFAIKSAGTGLEGLEMAKKETFDVILMDVRLPDMNGLEVVKEIRKFNRDVCIIAQTAYAMQSDEMDAMTAGCNDFIPKPIHAEVLLHKISKQLQDF